MGIGNATGNGYSWKGMNDGTSSNKRICEIDFCLATIENIDSRSTLDDFMNFRKTELQDFLRKFGQEISGTKLELAQRAFDFITTSTTVNSGVLTVGTESDLTGKSVPLGDINEIKIGWSRSEPLPKITRKTIENYLIHSRTDNEGEMSCHRRPHRQYIRGFNFFKEKYIVKVMKNPSQIARAHCICPAGLGEGCTHVASLLFALENAATNAQPTEINEISCTSKPFEWSKHSKRQKESEKFNVTVGDDIAYNTGCGIISVRYGRDLGDNKKKTEKMEMNEKGFLSTLVGKINPNAVLLDLLPYPEQWNSDICSDLNVIYQEEVETTAHIIYASDNYIDIGDITKTENIDRKEKFYERFCDVPPAVV
ncbi:hypothetical protein ScPMuIL_015045, partial [Solemya velum]